MTDSFEKLIIEATSSIKHTDTNKPLLKKEHKIYFPLRTIRNLIATPKFLQEK